MTILLSGSEILLSLPLSAPIRVQTGVAQLSDLAQAATCASAGSRST
jgi:hypothetical protein